MAVPTAQLTSSTPRRISYCFMALLLVLVVALHLAPPVVACLFSYLALTKLVLFRRGKWLAVLIYIILLSAIFYALGHFARVTVKAMPVIADQSIPSVIDWAQRYGFELPFTDYDSLKELAMETVKGQAHNFGSFAKVAKGATTSIVLLIAGCVVAMSLFLTPHFELGKQPAMRNDLYWLTCGEIARRFATLYDSFVTVMGAQIAISAINTVLTGIFVAAVHLPYGVVVIGVTFICGLLPVVGNILSNTVVVMIGFTISPQMAIGALAFLVVVHKLEYFLNSKIVGLRIRNPLWLTLIGLIVGEKLMGVPGMILAPVVLNYIKLEASKIQVKQGAPASVPPGNAGRPEVTAARVSAGEVASH